MAVIGAGRVGTAVAVLLERANHRVVAASGLERTRGRVRRYLPFTSFVPAQQAHQAAKAATLIILAVPDDAIVEVCSTLAANEAFGDRHHVVHLSGSVGLDALAPARDLGAQPLSVHPMQTVPDVEDGLRNLPGSSFAVTASDEAGFAFGESLVVTVEGRPFRVEDDLKPLYHAAAVFCSNYLVAVQGMAEHLFSLAGLEEPVLMFAPLARASLETALDRGPAAALTGPAVRGDMGTIVRNLDALVKHAPEAVGAYVELAAVAADVAVRGGRLDEHDRARLQEVLDQWR